MNVATVPVNGTPSTAARPALPAMTTLALVTRAVLAALTTLTLVLPNFTISTPGPVFNVPQLAFAGVVSLVIYGVFVFVQTVRHRDYFLAEGQDGDNGHAMPSRGAAVLSAVLLLVTLVAVGPVRALVALGWPAKHLGDRRGFSSRTNWFMTSPEIALASPVRVSTRDTVRALYDEL